MKDLKMISEETTAKYLFYYFKILGIAPMCMNANKSNLFAASKLAIAHELFLFVVLLILNVRSIHYFYRHYDMAYRNKFEKTFNSLQDSLILSTAMLALLAFVFHQKKAIVIINQIYQIRKSAILIDFAIYRRIPIASDVITTVCVIGIFWSAMTTTIIMYGTSYLSNAAPICFCNFIFVSIVLQYSVLLKFLKKLFAFVNDELSAITADSKCLIRVENSQVNSNTLLPVCRLYMSLTEVSQKVSEFYSPLMLLSILDIFLSCISSTYYIVKPFVFGKNRLPNLFFAHCLTFGALHSVILVVLTRCVTATVVESRKTREIVGTYLMNCENIEIARKLNQFSSYLILNKVKFTVFQLFSLDQSLLMSVIGSTTTYLVIILQLQDN